MQQSKQEKVRIGLINLQKKLSVILPNYIINHPLQGQFLKTKFIKIYY
jgi:hypothetical protein